MDGHLGKGQGVEMARDIVVKRNFASGNWIFGEFFFLSFLEFCFQFFWGICLDFSF